VLGIAKLGSKYQIVSFEIREIMIFLLEDGKAQQTTICFSKTFSKTMPTISFKLSKW